MISHRYTHKEKFEFEAGGSLDSITIEYHTSNRNYIPGKDTRKVIWICHAFTANSDPSDWWPELVGSGKFIDTDRYFVVCANMLGSPYGSSGPASINPATGKPFFFDFPMVTVRDMVRAHIILRKHLGIEKIDLMIGGSIGGSQALEWAIMEPDVTDNLFFAACSSKVTPWVTAFNESQRLALEADPTFRECKDLNGGAAGLKCARSIALISYRTYQGYNLTQSESDPDTMFADRAGSYQRYQGDKLVRRFDAYSYWYLSHALDSYNIGRGRGGVKAALSQVKCQCTVVGVDTDCLFPCTEQRYVAEHIPDAWYFELTSRFGHDGFLIESKQLAEIMRPLLPR